MAACPHATLRACQWGPLPGSRGGRVTCCARRAHSPHPLGPHSQVTNLLPNHQRRFRGLAPRRSQAGAGTDARADALPRCVQTLGLGRLVCNMPLRGGGPFEPTMVPASRPAHCAGRAPSEVPIVHPVRTSEGPSVVHRPGRKRPGRLSLIHTGPHPTSCTARHTGRAYLTAAASAGGSDLPPTRLRCRPRLPRAHNDRTISHTRAFARAPCVRRRLCLSRWFTLPPDLIVRSRLRLSLSSSGPCTFCLSERHKVQFTPEDTQLHDARSAV